MKFSECHLCFHNSCEIWPLFSPALMRNSLLQITKTFPKSFYFSKENPLKFSIIHVSWLWANILQSNGLFSFSQVWLSENTFYEDDAWVSYVQKAQNHSRKVVETSWKSYKNKPNEPNTVEPVYNGPVLSGQFSKSRFFAHTNAVHVFFYLY